VEIREKKRMSTKKELTVKIGEDVQVYCEDCQTEYLITHEPMYTDPQMSKQFGGKPKAATFCPFCGSDTKLEVR
jgi:Zn finger protein HypA/HybF involved in hydrogenase expression